VILAPHRSFKETKTWLLQATLPVPVKISPVFVLSKSKNSLFASTFRVVFSVARSLSSPSALAKDKICVLHKCVNYGLTKLKVVIKK